MTFLLMMAAGVTMYHVGNWYGYKRGEREITYRRKKIQRDLSRVG